MYRTRHTFIAVVVATAYTVDVVCEVGLVTFTMRRVVYAASQMAQVGDVIAALLVDMSDEDVVKGPKALTLQTMALQSLQG
jgi:hypothetical protein